MRLPGLFSALLLFWVTGVSAQPNGELSTSSWAGEWQAGSTTVTVEVGSWGPDCPARPVDHTLPAQGSVSVRNQGDALLFGTDVRTDQCWSDNRDLRRVSTRYSAGRWETLCRTSQRDSRRETGRYTVRESGPDRLIFTDRTEYDWQLNESRCTATMVRRRTYERARVPTNAGVPEPPAPCTPGAPARIRIVPRSAQLEPGGEFRFRVRVTDESGCTVRDARPAWSLRGPPGRNATLTRGLFRAGPSAAEAEGRFKISARVANITDEVEATVAPADLRSLTAAEALQRTQNPLVDGSDAHATAGLGVAARERETRSIYALVAIALLGVVALALAFAVMLPRRRAKQTPETAPDAPDDDIPSSRPAAAVEVSPSETPSDQALICPTCRRGFAPNATRCPYDNDELVPYVLFVQREKERDASERRVCPVCGTTYTGHLRFCSKDGAELVQVN